MLILDTHILIFLVDGGLTRREIDLIDRYDCGVVSIVLYEIAQLHRLGRIAFHLDHPNLLQILKDLTLWPISIDVCRCVSQLDFRSDPADEVIAATSIAHQIPLLTRDRRLLASKVIPLAT